MRDDATSEAWHRARALVLAHGWNATAYQILAPGLSLWFSRERDAVVGYAGWGGVRVVAGAPVCGDADLEAVADEFEAESRALGERVCWFAAGTRLETIRRDRPGYARVLLGAQPSWDPTAWPGLVRQHPSLRAQLHRARNKGVVVRTWSASDATSSDALRTCLDAWLASRRMPPMHFLVEPETLDRLEDRRVFVAERGGLPVAFLVATPVPERRGWLVEQIVRGADAPNGTAETLVGAAFEAAIAEDLRYVTLGLAPLSKLHRERVATPWWLDVVFGWLRLHGARFYDFRGLETFKAKFRPTTWEPIWAIVDQRSFSPRILLAIAAVFGGGDPFRFVAAALVRALREEVRRAVAWVTRRRSPPTPRVGRRRGRPHR